MNSEEIDRIVQAYGRVLDQEALPPGGVADVKKLPFPKDQIKQALQLAILLTKDEKLSEALIAGYLQLPDWQEGVGERTPEPGFSKADVTADEGLKSKQAREKCSGGQRAREWQPTIEAERQALIQELGRLVAGASATRSKQRR